MLRYLWLTLGCMSFLLGTAGIFLPLLPTVPFYMVALFCFAKGSKKMHRWFVQSDLYKKHAADFMQKKEMTLKAKMNVMVTVTLLMGLALWLLPEEMYIGYLIIGTAWTVHVLYFIFGIRTKIKMK